MNVIPTHIPEHISNELQRVVDRIVATGQVEMIVLFGSYARGDFKLSQGKRSGKKSDFDLLLVTASNIESKLERELNAAFANAKTRVQLIIEDIERLNTNIEADMFFYTDIVRQGIILYDSQKCFLSRAINVTASERLAIAKSDFEQWYHEAKISFYGYEKYKEIHEYRRAAFNLQQTVELCYKTINIVFTHYVPYEHYCSIIRDDIEKYDSRISEAFPLETKEQQDLFIHLDKAYIGARYLSEEYYRVTNAHLEYWASETQKLLTLTTIICTDKIEQLSLLV